MAIPALANPLLKHGGLQAAETSFRDNSKIVFGVQKARPPGSLRKKKEDLNYSAAPKKSRNHQIKQDAREDMKMTDDE